MDPLRDTPQNIVFRSSLTFDELCAHVDEPRKKNSCHGNRTSIGQSVPTKFSSAWTVRDGDESIPTPIIQNQLERSIEFITNALDEKKPTFLECDFSEIDDVRDPMSILVDLVEIENEIEGKNGFVSTTIPTPSEALSVEIQICRKRHLSPAGVEEDGDLFMEAHDLSQFSIKNQHCQEDEESIVASNLRKVWLKTVYSVLHHIDSSIRNCMPWTECQTQFSLSDNLIDTVGRGILFKSKCIQTFKRRLSEHGFARISNSKNYTIPGLHSSLSWSDFERLCKFRQARSPPAPKTVATMFCSPKTPMKTILNHSNQDIATSKKNSDIALAVAPKRKKRESLKVEKYVDLELQDESIVHEMFSEWEIDELHLATIDSIIKSDEIEVDEIVCPSQSAEEEHEASFGSCLDRTDHCNSPSPNLVKELQNNQHRDATLVQDHSFSLDVPSSDVVGLSLPLTFRAEMDNHDGKLAVHIDFDTPSEERLNGVQKSKKMSRELLRLRPHMAPAARCDAESQVKKANVWSPHMAPAAPRQLLKSKPKLARVEI
jgi:hypothetical protein